MQNFEPPDSKMSPTLVLDKKKKKEIHKQLACFPPFKGKSLTLTLLCVSACYFIRDSTFSHREAILTLRSNVFVLGQQSQEHSPDSIKLEKLCRTHLLKRCLLNMPNPIRITETRYLKVVLLLETQHFPQSHK